eukprot:GHUV01038465.1.p1 GENE.GHUV01038465.1~~GHUV01038465.1.p1  ORF type:complete len:122 (+),score=28.62 GHUV01038465.1:191-556(+)
MPAELARVRGHTGTACSQQQLDEVPSASIYCCLFVPVCRAAELRKLLSSLGPSFVKIGQALSARPDLLPQVSWGEPHGPRMSSRGWDAGLTMLNAAMSASCVPTSGGQHELTAATQPLAWQ